MADLSEPLRTMKRILILLLALIPFIAGAQEYILSDETTADGRLIETKPYAFFSNGKMYLIGFSYLKGEKYEVYMTTIVSTEQSSQWEVPAGGQAVFKMAKGNRITLKSITESTSEYEAPNDYTITSSYIIPIAKAHDMLDAIKDVFVYMKNGGDSDIVNIKVPYDAASFLMMSYLELLSKTGR